MARNQGTYYSYFKPQFAAFGIDCNMLNWTPTYGKPNHTNPDKALELLKQGYYLIALMNKGNWTSSGHFIVVWWADGKIRINDPASTRDSLVNGDLYTFRSEAKYYWWVDARKYNHPEDEINMHQTGIPLAYCFGTREHRNLDELRTLLAPFHIRTVYADGNYAYRSRITESAVVTGKKNTQRFERKHLSLRTWCSRLVRKTLCFSKLHLLYDIVVGLVFNCRLFGRILPLYLI